VTDYRHEIWIDRGGTFTDFVALDRATGAVATLKIPSSDRAPVEGIRRLLGLDARAPLPPCDVRLGTTIATNALLERRGARCALAITRGFGDLLAIGDQSRPDLFALDIRRAAPLPEIVLEVAARCCADGAMLERPDRTKLLEELSAIRARGIDSLAVVVLNDHRHGVLEQEILALARAAGFGYVVLSSELCPELGLLTRAETAALDAYLTPPLRAALVALLAELDGSRLRVMQSNGALTTPERLRGPAALLSGPAGGVVAAARLAERAGFRAVIGFDMGGTSTDVCRSTGGRLEIERETAVSGMRVRAPTLAVRTIASGGGSICRFDGRRLTVGPESAGAVPGPLCYGDPRASELTISDVNLLLGRLLPDRFPFVLERARAEAKASAIADDARSAGHELAPERLLAGFLEIANRAMAEAIRAVSIGQGHDVRTHALFVLGGAGGQHACQVARLLGIETIVFHPFGGVLAALGLGLADVGWHATRELILPLTEAALATAKRELEALSALGSKQLMEQVGTGH
jgi:5-oxoprolinase (ATP-hydrolysing)